MCGDYIIAMTHFDLKDYKAKYVAKSKTSVVGEIEEEMTLFESVVFQFVHYSWAMSSCLRKFLFSGRDVNDSSSSVCGHFCTLNYSHAVILLLCVLKAWFTNILSLKILTDPDHERLIYTLKS